ncbi:MAG: hypothetical protein HY756_12235 [Nitrospirae bacterium]|nr:hypothetical protein [Nitrospirota bacterium]
MKKENYRKFLIAFSISWILSLLPLSKAWGGVEDIEFKNDNQTAYNHSSFPKKEEIQQVLNSVVRNHFVRIFLGLKEDNNISKEKMGKVVIKPTVSVLPRPYAYVTLVVRW